MGHKQHYSQKCSREIHVPREESPEEITALPNENSWNLCPTAADSSDTYPMGISDMSCR